MVSGMLMSINITVGDVIVWLLIGSIVGTFVGAIVKLNKQGFGRFTNIGVGLIGALIGSLLFNGLRIDLGLRHISISLQDLIAATIGSFIFLGAAWFIKRRKSKL